VIRIDLGIIGDNTFFVLLVILFLISLVPFKLSPSIPLTLGLSLPPFILIYVQAQQKRRQVAAILRSEHRFLEAFASNAERRWLELMQNPTERISEQEIIDLVPEAMRRLSSHSKFLIEEIAKGKIYLLDTPRDSIIRPFRDDLEAQLRDTAYFAGLSTKVGILGTFFGFIVALGTLSAFFAAFGTIESGASEAAANVKSSAYLIQETLQNLAYAFVKSIYGLALAIWITSQTSNLRSALDKLYPMFDRALSFGQAFVNRMTLADPTIHASLVDVRNGLRDVHQRLLSHSADVAESLRAHGLLINEQTRTFVAASDGMIKVQANWATAFNNLNEAAEGFERRTSGAITQVERGVVSAASKFEQVLRALETTQSDLSETTGSMIDALKDIGEKWTAHQGTALSISQEHERQVGRWTQATGDSLESVREQLASIQSGLIAANSVFKSGSDASKELTGAIARLDSTIRDRFHHVEAVARSQRRSALPWIVAIVTIGVATDLIYGDPLAIRRLIEFITHKLPS
jgi:hypothetical protein